MKDEIRVGEYIRNIWGDIYKYDYLGHPMFLGDKFYNRIVKHSKEIIDLVEEGDYVNGEPVEKIETGLDWGREITTTTEYLTNEEDIESIITKEQIKQIEFRIKE